MEEYTVDKKLRQLQLKELDLLKELLRVCKKHNLRIFADFGTLLGAVRHQGVIPWDDDIDVSMPRPDYDRLAEIAKSEFKRPYFFQDTYTEPLHARGHAQLRNSDTTGILEEEYDLDINHGIFIDIFPLDGVPCDEAQQEKDKAETKRLINVIRYGRPFKLPVTWNPIKMLRCWKRHQNAVIFLKHNGWSYQDCYRRFEDILRSTDYETAAKVGSLGFLYRSFKDHTIYDNVVMMKFEDIEIPCPVGYEPLLRIIYGDNYMTPIHKPAAHLGLVFDVERPYQEVQAELRHKHSWWKDFYREILKKIKQM